MDTKNDNLTISKHECLFRFRYTHSQSGAHIGFFLWCVCVGGGGAGIFGMVTVVFLKSDCR